MKAMTQPNRRPLQTALTLAAAALFCSFAARAESRPAASSAAQIDSSSEASAQAGSGTPAGTQLKTQLLGVQGPIDADMQAGPGDDEPAPPPPPPGYRPRRRVVVNHKRDAREGPIFGFGLGGVQQYLSGAGHSGAFDTNLRFGYGFSDRFQLLFDLGGSEPPQDSYQTISMWHFRVHGQTVLAGDRRGNGLNVNFGIGVGGVNTEGYGNVHDGNTVGFTFGGGLSYELRLTPHFALAPEIFAAWQQAPNGYNLPLDIAWQYGARLNFLWYSPF